MFQEIVVVHHRRGDFALPASFNEAPWVSWNTCLREIRVAELKEFAEKAPTAAEVFVGESAYQFCLEVVCGLHSPMVGETEVLGQFKELVSAKNIERPPLISKFLHSILVDAKEIRHKHLSKLGGQSYGSL